MTLIVVFGKRKWNWPRSTSPDGSNPPSCRSRTGPYWLEGNAPPRAGTHPGRRRPLARSQGGRPGSDSTRGSSRSRSSSWPRTHPRRGAGSEGSRRRFRPPRAGRAAARAPPAARACPNRLTKTNGPPRGDAERHEAEAVGGEARLSLRARGGAKRPVEVVRPGVVRALQRLAAALALADERAAVPANIEEGAQHLSAPDEQYRNVSGTSGHVPAGLVELVTARDVLPVPPEDALLLGRQHGRVDVPAPGQCLWARCGLHAASVTLRSSGNGPGAAHTA